MRQKVVQMGTSGKNVSERINAYLEANPGWKLTTVFGLDVQRVGGSEKQALVVFETKDEAVSGDLVTPK